MTTMKKTKSKPMKTNARYTVLSTPCSPELAAHLHKEAAAYKKKHKKKKLNFTEACRRVWALGLGLDGTVFQKLTIKKGKK